VKARERRYSRYKSVDVWATLYEQQHTLEITVIHGTVQGNTVSLTRKGTTYKAVILARSSDWYTYSLNCQVVWKHGIQLVICGTHDSCLPVPVQALDHPKWYDARTTRVRDDDLSPTNEKFDQQRRTAYGHNIFIGALMCGREDALKRLATMKEGTVLRIKAELRRLHKRRQGKPLSVGQ